MARMNPAEANSPTEAPGAVYQVWSSARIGVLGLMLSAGIGGVMWGLSQWPQLPVPASSQDGRLQWVSDPKSIEAWQVWAPDPTRFARAGAPGFSDAIRARRPVVTYQVAEYLPPITWFDVGTTGERIGPMPAVAEPFSPRRPETMERFLGETTVERLASVKPIVEFRGELRNWRQSVPMEALGPVRPGGTLAGPTVLELAAGPTGSLVLVRLAKSSGDVTADQAALRSVRRLQWDAPEMENPPLLDAAGPLTWGEVAIHWTVATTP